MKKIRDLMLQIRPILSKWEFLAYVLILLFAAYVLAPRYWEPGGESFKNWVSARIFRETGGFPRINHGPLYNIYLQLFSFFDYPLSIQLEHLVTHLFAYTCIFLLLHKFLPTIPALLLTCAWIPTIWVVEGTVRVGGIGFLALYFRTDKESVMNKGYLPVSLGAAALLDTAYIPFLMGHILGTVIKRRSVKKPIITFAHFLRPKNILPVIVKAAMVLLVLLTIFFQSKRPDNNCHEFNYPWVPFPQTEALTISSLAVGNCKYMIRNIPQSEWIYQDWYFTHKEIFGGASSILQAALNNPNVFFRNIRTELPSAVMIPANFIIGFGHLPLVLVGILVLLSWVLLPIVFYRVYQYYKAKDLVPHIYSIIFGTASVVAALLLVWVRFRYVIVLLPVGLLMAAHLGSVIQSIINRLRRPITTLPNTVSINRFDLRRHNILIIFGSFLILLGFLANEWILTTLLSPDGVLDSLTRIWVWLIDFLLIFVGMLLIIKRDFLLAIFKKIKDSCYSNTQSWFTNVVILVMAGVLTLSSPYSRKATVSVFLDNPFLLSGKMMRARSQLLSSVNKQTKVLALEESWIRAFADVDLDKVFHPLYLPPFKDPSGETDQFLDSLDVIWVSHDFSRKAPSVATQTYLRYELHVEPFLKKAPKRGWTVHEVKGFGKIYRRPSSDID